MKIIQLHSENIKRIKAVDITPDDNVIVLSGKNGEGKTSVLDSIWLALQYRAASKNNPSPLRAGTESGLITIDLGDYIVTRKFTATDSSLEIRTPDGSKITSPQKLLDGMIGDLSFDPWEFARKSESDQRQMISDVLYAITDGKIDLANFEQRYKSVFEKRSEENREKKRLSTILTTMRPPTQEDPCSIISAEEITKSISEALLLKNNVESLINERHKINSLIQELEAKIISLKKDIESINAKLYDMPPVPDIDILKSKLRNIEEHNQRARDVINYNKTKNALDQIESSITALNEQMELIEIEKSEALENSPLPVKNLRITADGVMVMNETGNMIPFCQASAAQRLRISLAIAMSANPKLRVIRIADGSLLDDTSMDIIRNMATDNDYQCWIEYASRNENDRMGVYIQDGRVA